MCKKLKFVLHVRKCTLNNTTQISQSKQDVLDNSINIQETEYHDNVAVVVAVCPVSRSLSAAFRFSWACRIGFSARWGGKSVWLALQLRQLKKEGKSVLSPSLLFPRSHSFSTVSSCLASTSTDISSVRSGCISETLSQQYWIFLLNDEYRLWILERTS